MSSVRLRGFSARELLHLSGLGQITSRAELGVCEWTGGMVSHMEVSVLIKMDMIKQV